MEVLNFGSLNLDYVYSVDHMVVAGETLASDEMNIFCGGKGMNQSIALSRAGVPVYHAGMIGEEGQILLDVCKKYGVNTQYVKKIEGKSGHTIIQVDKNGQNCILLYGGANKKMTKEYIDSVLDEFERGDMIVLQNEINMLDYIIDRAFEKGMMIVLNPSPYNAAIEKCSLNKVTLFFINEIEGAQITGEKEPECILKKFSRMYPEAEVVLTLGGDGAVYQKHGQRYEQNVYPAKVVDTTAAGDTFTGYFIEAMLRKKDIKECLDVAAKAASIAISREGAASSIPMKEEVMKVK